MVHLVNRLPELPEFVNWLCLKLGDLSREDKYADVENIRLTGIDQN